MRSRAVLEWIEALGAGLIVLGLAFWALPVALVAAGSFLVLVANVPGGAAPVDEDGQRRGARRAEARR